MSKRYVILGVVALVAIPILLWWNRCYQSQAELRMLFWQAQGAIKVPLELASESSTRQVLLSSLVRERVNRRLPWNLSEKEYSQSVDLSSNRHDWNPKREVFFRVFARARNPEHSKLLGVVASEELSKRCQELAQEFEDQLWDVEILKVQSALSHWEHQKQKQKQRETWSPERIRRLKLSLAVAQMHLGELEGSSGTGGEDSQKVAELKESLNELQRGLDKLWLQGVSGEVVVDLEREYRDRQVQLQVAIESNQAALLDEAQAWLKRLENEERRRTSPDAEKTLREGEKLRQTLGTLVRAQELAGLQTTMYCLVFRPAESGEPQAKGPKELLPVILAVILLILSISAHRRQLA